MTTKPNPLDEMEHAADELDTYSMNAGHGKSSDAATLREARAAVAELVEAAKAFDRTYAWHWDLVNGGLVVTADRVERFEDTYQRLTEALARFEEK